MQVVKCRLENFVFNIFIFRAHFDSNLSVFVIFLHYIHITFTCIYKYKNICTTVSADIIHIPSKFKFFPIYEL